MERATSSQEPYLDPRVRRTRQMFEGALEDLMTKRDFETISVGDVAELATLNRATFYAHFVDKQDLFESMVVSRFQRLLLSRGVAFDGSCPSALYGIVLAVCDFLVGIPYCSEQRQVAQHLELAMVGIVRKMVSAGIYLHPPKAGAEPNLVAAALAGGIYASAKQWLRTENRPDAAEVAKTITKLVAPMLG